MTAADLLAIGPPMLAGLLLIVRSSSRMLASGALGRGKAAIERLHNSAHRRLIEIGLFRFSGACLVTSMRGWLAGEVVFLCGFAAAFSPDVSLRNGVSSIAVSAVLGGSVVYFANRDQARKQIAGIRNALPMATFLMSLLLDAGMGSYAALQEVTRALPRTPLVKELEELTRSRMIGVPRAEAIERSRRRVPIDDYRTFLNLIEQGERLGVGLSRALEEHSSKMMEAQGHRAEIAAQKAAVKLLFPLVAFIFPAVFLVIFSPVILSLWAMLGR